MVSKCTKKFKLFNINETTVIFKPMKLPRIIIWVVKCRPLHTAGVAVPW